MQMDSKNTRMTSSGLVDEFDDAQNKTEQIIIEDSQPCNSKDTHFKTISTPVRD